MSRKKKIIPLNENIEIIKRKVESGKMLARVIPRSTEVIDQINKATKFLDDIYKNRKIRTIDRVFCLINNINSESQIPICRYCNKNHSIFVDGGKVGFSEVCSQKCGVRYGGTKNGNPEISKKAINRRKRTVQKKYGVDHISQLDNIKKKKKDTAIKIYGTLKAAYYDTLQKTIKKKYKTDNISKLDFVKKKKKETSIKNYGTDYPWQSDKGKEERKQAVINKYNVDNISKTEVTKEKKKQTFLKHYGEDNIFKTAEFIRSHSGENNPNWKGGVSHSPYCEIFFMKEFKNMIKERDLKKCLNPVCNKVNNTDIVIHHIDYNKMNCHPSNLITICRSCNTIANFNRDWHQSWYESIIFNRYGTRGI